MTHLYGCNFHPFLNTDMHFVGIQILELLQTGAAHNSASPLGVRGSCSTVVTNLSGRAHSSPSPWLSLWSSASRGIPDSLHPGAPEWRKRSLSFWSHGAEQQQDAKRLVNSSFVTEQLDPWVTAFQRLSILLHLGFLEQPASPSLGSPFNRNSLNEAAPSHTYRAWVIPRCHGMKCSWEMAQGQCHLTVPWPQDSLWGTDIGTIDLVITGGILHRELSVGQQEGMWGAW